MQNCKEYVKIYFLTDVIPSDEISHDKVVRPYFYEMINQYFLYAMPT